MFLQYYSYRVGRPFIVWSIHSITQQKSVSNYRYGHPLGAQPDERTWRSIWALHLGAAAWDPVVMPCCLGEQLKNLSTNYIRSPIAGTYMGRDQGVVGGSR